MIEFVIGLQWGDEGKGKIVDYLASSEFSAINCVARYNGGNNSGHTIIKDEKKLITHILPSGILNSKIKNYILAGTVLDLNVLIQEVEEARRNDIFVEFGKNLFISENVPLILPFHIEKDMKNENSQDALGTTKKGIGPAYEDYFGRRSILVKDLSNKVLLYNKLKSLQSYYHGTNRELNTSFISDLYDSLNNFYTIIKSGIVEDENLFNDPFDNWLLEGAQAVMLDVIHGDYPFTTSSSVLPQWFKLHYPRCNHPISVIGVMKAYSTRVGEGPFEKMPEDVESIIRKIGKEYGATTGRPRKCGWLDLEQIKYTMSLVKPNKLVLIKSDVLGQLNLPCVKNGDSLHVFSGWGSMQNMNEKNIKSFEKFLSFIEKELNIPFMYISSGPDRHDRYKKTVENINV